MKFKVGDIVKLKKDTTLNKLTTDHWCGCQTSTMELLKSLSFRNFNEQLEAAKVDGDCIGIESLGTIYLIRSDIFEIVRKKNILDDKERRYLKTVIRPFKNKISHISKEDCYDGECYISIELENEDINLPYFKKETMYNGMEEDKKYTLKELGLDV